MAPRWWSQLGRLASASPRPGGQPDPLLLPLLPGQSSLRDEVGNQEGGQRPPWAPHPAGAQGLIWGGPLLGEVRGESGCDLRSPKPS